MRDDAIAPVIAVMLILAAIVTFLSIWNAIYVPSMKESSEVSHLQNVETSFVHFSSDIDQAVSSHQDSLVFSEPVQLGGGDTLVNQLKSSGALQVQNESDPVYILTLSGSDGQTTINGTLINFSYEPVNNFWQDQGYTWQYGYINVTKYGTLSTPLTYYNMTDVHSPSGTLQTLAKSFVLASATTNTTPSSYGNLSTLDIWVVSMYASPDHSFVSSNGFGTLRLTSNVTTTHHTNIEDIFLESNDPFFGPVVNDTFSSNINTINTTYSAYPANITTSLIQDTNDPDYPYNSCWTVYQQPLSPVTINVHQVNIAVSAS